ncbi:MAG: tetratricopeptide repeat-containing sensor histidine kinase [Bacteroidales bacterium]
MLPKGLLLAIISVFFIWVPSSGQLQIVPLTRSDSARLVEWKLMAAQQQKTGDLREESRYYDLIAFLYWEHNFTEQAIEWYKKSLVINQKLENQAGISMINSNLGMLYADLKQYEKSLEHFNQTLNYRQMIKDKVGIITTRINISVVLNNLGRFEESARNLLEALTLARELNDMDQMKSCYGMLSETYEKARQPDKAKYYFDLYRTFHEELQRQKEAKAKKIVEETQLQLQLTEAEKRNKELELLLKQKELSEAEQELKTAGERQKNLYDNLTRSELRNELLKRDNELKNAELKNAAEKSARQRTQLLSLAFILFLLLALTVVVWRAYLNKKKTNRLLAEQKAEIERQKNAIESAYQQLRELTDFKEGIRSMIVHDLKNPLNAILNPPSHYKESLRLELAHRAGRQMLNLVMNFLDVQKFEENKLPLEIQACNLSALARLAVDETSFLGQSRGLVFLVNIPENIVGQCDPEIIKRVLVNLLTNAIKYAFPQSEITIHGVFDEERGVARISVTNAGEGISSEFLPRVFDKFAQGDARESGAIKSTGLGLTFCKLAVEAHKGQIGVESTPGKTTTFWFTLPAQWVDTSAEGEVIVVPPFVNLQPELNREELQLIRAVVAQLKSVPMHKISLIRKIIAPLRQKPSDGILQWLEAFYFILETNDSQKYSNFLMNYAKP